MITDERPTATGYLVLEWLDLFIETGNPIYAWRAYQNARRLGVPVPDEILQYIDSVADGIIKTAINSPAPKDRPNALARALGLSKKGAGPGSAFTEYTERQDRRKMAMQAFFEIEGGASQEGVFLDLGEKNGNQSGSTVRRCYEAHKVKWAQMADALIESGLVEFGNIGADGKPQVNLKMHVAGTADDMREAAILLVLIQKRIRT